MWLKRDCFIIETETQVRDKPKVQPRRSVLYMPGANSRAMEKAKNLPCDSIIFDLEDAVSPDAKASARTQVAAQITASGYGYRELIVRCNSLDTPWGAQDVATFASMDVAGLLFPKIESQAQVGEIIREIDANGGGDKSVWLMIETPRGVLDMRDFADHDRVGVLVMGTSDLVKELRAQHTVDRHNLDYALQHCVLTARMLGKEILDGVHLNFRDEDELRAVCRSGRDMGFDGKTLIHPGQVAAANEAYGYSEAEIEEARAILDVWAQALEGGKGVAVLDGKLIENLHAAEATRVLAFAQAIAERSH